MKNVTLKIRVTPEQREAWTKAALQAGAASLSDFVRETIDEEIQWVACDFEETKQFLEALDGQWKIPQAGVAESVDALASSPSDESREGSSPSSGIQYGGVCPRKFTHITGVYCTACGTTPA